MLIEGHCCNGSGNKHCWLNKDELFIHKIMNAKKVLIETIIIIMIGVTILKVGKYTFCFQCMQGVMLNNTFIFTISSGLNTVVSKHV